MPDDSTEKLRQLEEDYLMMPPALRKQDLVDINDLRSQLGLPQVDEQLAIVSGQSENTAEAIEESPTEDESLNLPAKPDDYESAKKIYQQYLQRIETLKIYQQYARDVADATNGPHQTPVRPLATMGTNGGPLLCDHCKKPMVLEGSPCHGMNADDAWKKKVFKRKNWNSWILGGMVVEIETNGTLRVYHGYPNRNKSDCCNIADEEDKTARKKFDSSTVDLHKPMLLKFLQFEFADRDENQLRKQLTRILDVMFGYDPGLGVNQPPNGPSFLS